MRRLVYRPFVALLAGLVLATGCRSTAPRPAADAVNAREGDDRLLQRSEAHAHYAAGVVHELNGETPKALDEFYLAAQSAPRDPELLLDVSNRLMEGRRFEQAVTVLHRAATLPDAPDIVFVRLGFAYIQLGQTKKAIEANRLAVRKLPRLLPVRRNLYLTYLQAKQPTAALQTLNEAAAEPGTDADYLINLAELYVNYGRQFADQRAQVNGKALELLQRAEKKTPRPMALQLKQADILNLLGDSKGAAKIYLNLLDTADLSAPVRDLLRARLLDIFLQSHDHARAREQLNGLLLDNPGNASALYFLGSIAFEEKRWADAIADYQRSLSFNPGFEQAHYDLASAQLAAGQGADAVATMEAARKRFSTNFVSEYLLGLAYHEQKKYPEALSHLRAAETLARTGETNRLTDGFYFQLGATSERAGDRAAAEKYFEQCLALAPNNAEALNYLGYMWAEKGEHLTRAREMIEKALKAEPDNAAFLDSMGWVCYQLGQPREAVEYLRKAVAADPKEPDATVYDHLGDAYAALKDTEQARAAWTKSLSLEASDAVQKKLDALKSPQSR